MATEYILAIILVVIATITTLVGYISTRRAINQHTKLLKSQAEVISHAKRRVQADMHRKASDKFEKAVEENSDYIKEDLRHTGEQLSAYVRTQMDGALHNELVAFRESSEKIGKVSSEALQQLQQAIATEQATILSACRSEHEDILASLKTQHQELADKINELVLQEKERRIQQFDGEMTRIVSAYVTQALTNQIDVDAQLGYILGELEQNKAAIVEDVRYVA